LNSLREQLIRDEERRLRVYPDSRGIPTIGVGRNLRDKGISVAESDLLLDNDIAEYTRAVHTALPWVAGLDLARQEVLINMAFNLGIYGLLEFKRTLDSIQHGNYDLAASQMLESKWATQVGPRAHRLSKQMRTGVRQ
jgi:lysozyme